MTGFERLPGQASEMPPGPATELPIGVRLQILSTEHWSLLATRSMAWNESFSRSSMFLSLLSGAIVALALVAQASAFGSSFVLFALLLLPVVLFVGLATYVRLVQVNSEDVVWVVGMNRLRHAYLQIAPELEPYFTTGWHDDTRGLLLTVAADPDAIRFVHGFVTTPSVVGVIDAVLAAILAAIAVLQAGAGLGAALIVGGTMFFAAVALLMSYQWRSFKRTVATLSPRFPSDTEPR